MAMLSSGGQQVRPHRTRPSPPSPTPAFTVFTRSIPTTPYVQARAELREKLHDKPGEKHTAYLPDNSPSTVRVLAYQLVCPTRHPPTCHHHYHHLHKLDLSAHS
jgi:hypothetical protein